MSRSSKVAAIALAVALVGGACTLTPPTTAYPELTYGHLGTIDLDVAELEIVDVYRSPVADPHVEHLFPVTPAAAVRRWAEDRLRPVGTAGTLRVLIEDAGVVETPLDRRAGLRGLLTDDQSERYEARLVVEVVAERRDRRESAFTRAEARRSITVPESISLAERERVWIDLTEALMQDLNMRLDEGIRRNMAGVIR